MAVREFLRIQDFLLYGDGVFFLKKSLLSVCDKCYCAWRVVGGMYWKNTLLCNIWFKYNFVKTSHLNLVTLSTLFIEKIL